MKTALRVAVEGYVLLPEGTLTEDQIVVAVPVSARAVRGYLKRLTTQRVLVLTPGIAKRYRSGPGLKVWLSKEPNTKVGGNSKLYLEKKAERDSIARRESALLRAVQLRRRLYGEDG